jgi:hypothetical protein
MAWDYHIHTPHEQTTQQQNNNKRTRGKLSEKLFTILFAFQTALDAAARS